MLQIEGEVGRDRYVGAFVLRYLLALALPLLHMRARALDILLMRPGQLAHPALWSGLDPDTG